MERIAFYEHISVLGDGLPTQIIFSASCAKNDKNVVSDNICKQVESIHLQFEFHANIYQPTKYALVLQPANVINFGIYFHIRKHQAQQTKPNKILRTAQSKHRVRNIICLIFQEPIK
jgi:hypothetical protein